MSQSQEQYRIGSLADELGVKKFVIRFWEKEFGLKASRSPGGQRFYKKKDFETFKKIKQLLYEEGFTIAGAKKALKNPTSKKESKKIGAHKTDFESDKSNINEQLIVLQKKLIRLQKLL